jgi:ABC-2 type transport system permease protein
VRHGLRALAGREVLRVLKLWSQTVAAPVVSSFLFILVFGLSLGQRIHGIHGIEYKHFIVPGLLTMAMIQAAYQNNSSTIFQARFDRYIHDVLAAPMRPWEMNLGMSVGGAVRALLIGGGLLALAIPFTGVPIEHPLVAVLALALALILFCALGIVVGIHAKTWDHAGFVNNIVILPLSFLGGTFYSIDRLPSPWHELSHANPLFYLINAVRYGFVGGADVSVALSLGITAALALGVAAWSSYEFAAGRRLKA